MKWVSGRLTKIQKTTRPDSVWPEVWPYMSEKQKREEIQAWKEEEKRRATSHKTGGLLEFVPSERVQEYNDILAHVRSKYALPPAPAMPTTAFACNAQNGRPLSEIREHQDQFASPGYASHEWFACVHTPVPMSKAMKIPLAKQAVDAEWKS